MLPNTESALRVFGNGVLTWNKQGLPKFYPFKTKTVTAAGNVLTSTPNLRVFVKSITIAYCQSAAGAGTEIAVTGVVNGETLTLAYLPMTASAVGTGSAFFEVGALLDKERVPAFAMTDVTAASCTMTYASSDDTV